MHDVGLPFPPISLSEELSLVMNYSALVNITFTWQPPLGLVIDDDLMYILNVNISILNLTEQFEVITNNLSYTHEIEDINQLCMFSYDVQAVVHVSLSSKNKVGIGMEVHKEILLTSKCVNAIPDPIITADLDSG
jgi:hypothetical protein